MAQAPAAKAAERLEVSSIKAVRPTLVKTIAVLERQDAAGAKAPFEAYDSGWNEIEVYISTRSADMYAALETNYQTRSPRGSRLLSPTWPSCSRM